MKAPVLGTTKAPHRPLFWENQFYIYGVLGGNPERNYNGDYM